MSDSKLYVIELGEDIGDIATMHRLVRCKECRYASEPLDAQRRWLVCDMGSGESVGPDDFCSFGEPIEDGDGDA